MRLRLDVFDAGDTGGEGVEVPSGNIGDLPMLPALLDDFPAGQEIGRAGIKGGRRSSLIFKISVAGIIAKAYRVPPHKPR